MNYIIEWLEIYRRFWEERMQRLEEYLRKVKEREAQERNQQEQRQQDSKH